MHVRRLRPWLGGILLAALASPGLARADDPVSTPAPARERVLEDRLKALEARYDAMERRHTEEVDALAKKYESLRREVASRETEATPATFNPPIVASASRLPLGGAGSADNLVRSRSATKTKAKTTRIPMKASFGPGLDLRSEDDEFQLQIRYLSQIDYRGYSQPNQDPVASGFSFPRQRLYFSGRLTKPIEYYLTLNRGYGSLDVFDAFINYRYDDRLMFKLGRFKTPFSYEFYAMSAPDFIVPDRSLFASNFGPNRQLGAMAWGQVLNKRVDYAAGLFNGNRVSFQDNNNDKSMIAYMNMRLFDSEDAPLSLKNLNFGGSVNFGNDAGTPLPNVLRTSIAASNAADATNIAPPFLAFNKNVVESGFRTLYGAHLAYFYKHLSLMAEWDAGFSTYATNSSNLSRVKVPIESYYVAFGYFLTGETLERRGPIKPLRPFDLRPGKLGPGAFELQGRFSSLNMGQQVFTGGLADQNLWTNHLVTTELGLSWYLNEYAKVYLDWEHALFGDPVLYRPGALQKTSDLFWLRFQIFF